jgi:ribosomal silencing factor RsfS
MQFMQMPELHRMLQVAELLADAHARDVVIVDVSQRCDFADSMVIATGMVQVWLLQLECKADMQSHISRSIQLLYLLVPTCVAGNSSGHVRAVAQAAHSKV